MKAAAEAKGRGVLLIAQMSTADAGTGEETVRSALDIAKKNPTLVAGFICQERVSNEEADQAFLYCTPGVNMDQKVM